MNCIPGYSELLPVRVRVRPSVDALPSSPHSRSRESICAAVDRQKGPLASSSSSSDVFGDKLGPDDGETKSSIVFSLGCRISLSTHDSAVSQFKVTYTYSLDWDSPWVSR